jgi:hypothetical protein
MLLLYHAGSCWTDSERQACLESLSADVWQLLLALLLAATPWVELLVTIPLGLVWDLPPVPLAAAVFLGNTLTIVPGMASSRKRQPCSSAL